jgi:hypothetical protein
VTARPRPARAVPLHGRTTLRDGAAEARRIAAERARAARTVAGHALDGPDCQMLLSVLGLSAVDGMPGDGLPDRHDNDEACSSTRLPGSQLPHWL